MSVKRNITTSRRMKAYLLHSASCFTITVLLVHSVSAQELNVTSDKTLSELDGPLAGISVGNSASLTANDLKITDSTNSIGVFVKEGAEALLNGLDIEQHNQKKYTLGAAVGNGGTKSNGAIQLNSSNISVIGSSASSGLYVYGSDANIDASNNKINVKTTASSSGDWSAGLRIREGKATSFNNIYDVSGNFTYGIGIIGSKGNGELISDSDTITTRGDYGYGIYAFSDSTGNVEANAQNLIISTNGTKSHSIISQGENSNVIISNALIETNGEYSYGLYAQREGTLSVDNAEVKTINDHSYGVASSRDSTITINNVNIETYGQEAHAARLFNGSFIEANNSSLLSYGNEAYSLFITDVEALNSQSTAIFDHSTLYSDRSYAIRSDGKYGGEVKLINSDIGSGRDQFASVSNGELNLELHKSYAKGSSIIDSNGVLNLSINDNSFWEITSNSYVTLLDNNDSKLSFLSNEGIYSTLQTEDLNSQNGLYHFNVLFQGNETDSDYINVLNENSGSGFVQVTKNVISSELVNGGIPLIALGDIDNSSFTLLGDYELAGTEYISVGAYGYKLDRDLISNNWALVSDGFYSVSTPVYEAYPQLLLGLNSLPTLQQRVGNRYWNNAGNKVLSQGADAIEAYAPAEEAGVVIEENGVWGRIEGSHTKIKSKTSTSGTDYDYNTFKMQAGLDGLLSETENGKLIGGVTVHYAHGKADVYSAHGDGDIKTNGYGFGGTLTWYGENGFYVDNQAQLTWYDSDLNSSTANKSLKHGNNGFGYALSVETGKRITIDENWSVTPQAQLMYSNVRFDSFTDTFGARISKKRADSLQGRIGISADYQNSWLNDQGTTNRSKVYGIANLYNEFLNGTKVDVSGVNFTNKRETLWAGIGLGGSYNWNDDKYSIYGEGSVNTSLKNFGDSYNYKGTVGLRVKW